MTGPLLWKQIILGLGAGVLAGFFGVGGGIVLVPGLIIVLGFPQKLAHGTSLVAIVPMALAGIAGYALDGSVDWVVAAALIAGSSVGVVIGTRLLNVLSGPTLSYLFVTVLVVAAVQMFLGGADATSRSGLDAWVLAGFVLLGLAAGVLSGLLGVGGGVVMVPGQVLLFGITDVVAKGTSLAVIVPTALIGTWRNLRNDNADVRVGVTVGVAGMVASFGASQAAVRLGAELSATLFGAFLLVVAIRMGVSTYREQRRAAVGSAT